jgi:hypothetical protein
MADRNYIVGGSIGLALVPFGVWLTTVAATKHEPGAEKVVLLGMVVALAGALALAHAIAGLFPGPVRHRAAADAGVASLPVPTVATGTTAEPSVVAGDSDG